MPRQGRRQRRSQVLLIDMNPLQFDSFAWISGTRGYGEGSMCGIGGMLPAMTCAIWRILGVGASFYILHTYTVGSSRWGGFQC